MLLSRDSTCPLVIDPQYKMYCRIDGVSESWGGGGMSVLLRFVLSVSVVH